MKTRIEHRLKRIEKIVIEMAHTSEQKSHAETPIERKIELYAKALEPIMQTMREDHKEDFLYRLEMYLKGEPQDNRYHYEPLHKALNYLIDTQLYKKQKPPVYLGPEAYEAYQNGALDLHDCADCGCEVPIFTGYTTLNSDGTFNVIHSRRVFNNCPLCGGRVGYAAYFQANKERGALHVVT